MAITFECEGCGKSYSVGDHLAGKTGPCKQCGRKMTVPRPPASDPYGLESSADEDDEPAPLPPKRTAPNPSSGSTIGKGPLVAIAGALGVLVVLAVIGLMAINRREPAKVESGQGTGVNVAAPGSVVEKPAPVDPTPTANLANSVVERPAPKSNQIPLPNFPEPGPAREIEPGIMSRVVDLGPYRPGAPPGSSGKLWLYLPSGDHPAKSLPCILISGTGGNLVTGRALLEGDRPEHLPYVRAGFAVVAFEVDGALADPSHFTADALNEAAGRFLKVKAGLVNARIAFEYASTKVRAVDPGRISVAGASTAGTLALLFAEFEPRLRACLAYGPINDVESFFLKNKGPQFVADMKAQGLSEIFGRLSPRNNEPTLDRPLFLFYGRSSKVAENLIPFAERLKEAGKPITTLTVADASDDILFQEGIPAAIAWLRKQGAGPGR